MVYRRLKLKEISNSIFNLLSDFILKKSGLFLPLSKKIMVMNRLKKRADELGFESIEDYIKYAIKEDNTRENFKIIGLLTTGKTGFFREKEHFNILLNNILPILFSKKKTIKVWSIGSSTGEEPYSLGIMIDMYIRNNFINGFFSILATDIDIESLRVARDGVYLEHQLSGVPDEIRDKYFIIESMKNEKSYRIRSFLRDRISFVFDNIIDSKIFDIFDIIFMKNTIMYFSTEKREVALNKVYNSIEEGGYFFIGITETIDDIKHNFKRSGFIKVYTKFQ